ncbi:MAG: hypothetical protein ACK5NN_05585 [Sphingomonadaceae bacterium]
MSSSKTSFAYVVLLGSLLVAGCKDNAEENPKDACSVESAGKKVFSGTPECIAQLKTEHMDGYWLVDFETSLFFLSQDDLEGGSIDKAYALNFLDAPPSEVSALLNLPSEKVFRVSFDGSKSDAPGVYGSVPSLRGGVVVKEDFSIESEVSDVPAMILSQISVVD